MIAFLELITSNLGFDIITLLAILFNLAVFIFMANDFRIGLIMMLLTNSMLTALAYTQSWDYNLVLTLTFLSVALLSLTLWTNTSYKNAGVV